ncbi:ParA family protein [bacterium]|nr:ParA family protein [bacterium]
MKVCSVINQKGGVGKTTTTINLGGALALMGKKVLLIDLDPQGNLSSGLDIDPSLIESKNVYHALVGQNKLVENVCETSVKNLYVIPSDNNLAGAEVELVDVKAREFKLKESFTEHLDNFDFALIDCPPSLGLLTINALSASDSYLIPMQSEFFAMQGLANILQTAKLVKRGLNPKLEEDGILLTMFDSRSNLSKQVYHEIKQFVGDRLYHNVIPRRVRLAESTSHGIPGVIYDPNCMGARSYIEVAKEFILRSQGLRMQPSQKQAFLPPDPVDRLGKKEPTI